MDPNRVQFSDAPDTCLEIQDSYAAGKESSILPLAVKAIDEALNGLPVVTYIVPKWKDNLKKLRDGLEFEYLVLRNIFGILFFSLPWEEIEELLNLENWSYEEFQRKLEKVNSARLLDVFHDVSINETEVKPWTEVTIMYEQPTPFLVLKRMLINFIAARTK
jgi:hypothetical protein